MKPTPEIQLSRIVLTSCLVLTLCGMATLVACGESEDDTAQSCEEITCPEAACRPEFQPIVPAGECCPVCKAIDPLVCEEQDEVFGSFLSDTLEAADPSCETNEDCTILNLDDNCDLNCTGFYVAAAQANEIRQKVEAFDEDNCVDCRSPEPCVDPEMLPPACVDGQCTFGDF
jgi:hypothetical protein